MEIIVPAAGLSTRFPGLRPKFTLTDYKGKLMLYRALAPYIGKHKITVGILQEHEAAHNIVDLIHREVSSDIGVVVLPAPTKGPADTVNEIIKLANIPLDAPILIKDCDSFFDHEIADGNYITVTKIRKNSVLKQLAAKSFVISNQQGIVTHIVEKDVVSDTFCIGGYKFDQARLFIEHYAKLSNNIKEVFISHVIESCILAGEVFVENVAENYIDVGTVEEWWDYNKTKPTLFCDVDGTVIHAQPRNAYGTAPTVLEENVKRLLVLQSQGAEIIFTTARPKTAHDVTVKMLQDLGFVDFQLLSGLYNSQRILINDYNNANPYPRAVAVNIKRDTDTLKDVL